MGELTEVQFKPLFDVLRNAGWSENRVVDVSERIKSMEENGWIVFPAARAFTINFSDLKPIDVERRSTIHLGDLRGDEERDVAIDWKRATGEDIFPIGFHNIVTVFLESTGKVYDNVEDTGSMSLLGEDLYAGLYNLFFGKLINTVHYNF